MRPFKIPALLFLLLSFCNLPGPVAANPVSKKNTPGRNNTAFALPDTRDITLYQVNMRVFSKEGNFKGVTARLDSIRLLGVNVIYLMPIYPVGKINSVNSPYCVRDYRALNEEFGTMNDLRDLIRSAHKRKMAVILDWVPNHTSFDNPWTSNKTWYLQDSAGNIMSPPGTGWKDVAQLNFANADMRFAMINAMKYWLDTTGADGFRCDYADGQPADFWKQAIDSLRRSAGHKILMMAEGKKPSLYEAGFDLSFGFNFFGAIRSVYEKGRPAWLIDTLNTDDYKAAGEHQAIIRYTTNHDVNSSDGTPAELFGGEQGSIGAFIIAAYMKSVPMIYNGQEVATPYQLSFPFTGRKIDWSLNPAVTGTYKKIIAFRNSSAAIRRGELVSYSTADVCAFTKQSNKEKVLVLVNLRNSKVNYRLPVAVSGSTWKPVLNSGDLLLKDNIELPPYCYLVFKNVSSEK